MFSVFALPLQKNVFKSRHPGSENQHSGQRGQLLASLPANTDSGVLVELWNGQEAMPQNLVINSFFSFILCYVISFLKTEVVSFPGRGA